MSRVDRGPNTNRMASPMFDLPDPLGPVMAVKPGLKGTTSFSPKLLKLQVDFGDPGKSGIEKRQILAGIGKKYEPEALVGKLASFIVNLEPRMLMGLESQGMILAVSDENNLSVLSTDKDIVPGSKIS